MRVAIHQESDRIGRRDGAQRRHDGRCHCQGRDAAATSQGHLRHRRLPQPHDLLRRLDLDAEAREEVDGHADTPWGLDWFVQAGHGGNGNRNCTLVEDATLATPAYPLVVRERRPDDDLGPARRRWQNSQLRPSARRASTSRWHRAPIQNMWRWQSIQEFQYPITEYLAALKNKPLFMGLESVVAGHEHTSMSVITGQMPLGSTSASCRQRRATRRSATRRRSSQWTYCFDRSDTRHEPRQHHRRWHRRQQLGLLRRGQPERGGSELERRPRRS